MQWVLASVHITWATWHSQAKQRDTFSEFGRPHYSSRDAAQRHHQATQFLRSLSRSHCANLQSWSANFSLGCFSLRPNTEATLQDFCRNFRTERLPALLQLHSRIGGMCRSYMFQDPFVSQDSLVNWLTSPQSSRLYASFRAALHHAHVQSTPNSRALNILDALLLIDLALWWRGDDGMEDF